MDTREPLHQELETALLSLNKVATRRIFKESGLSPIRFAEELFMPVLDRIGAKWERGDCALSQIYVSGRICESLLNELLPTAPAEQSMNPPMAVATLEDSHLLGKRRLSSVLRSSGYHFHDYGQQNLENLVSKVQFDGIRILLVSTLMLSSALRVKELRRRLDKQGLQVKIVVGGAPFRFDQALWREVGADATSPTATGALAIVRRLADEVRHENQ